MPISLGVKFLQKGVDEGYFRPLDPWLTMIHIMGTVTFYFNAENNLKNLVPASEWLAPQAIEAYADSAIAFILAGVLKPSETHK